VRERNVKGLNTARRRKSEKVNCVTAQTQRKATASPRRGCDFGKLGRSKKPPTVADAWKWREGYDGGLKTAATKAIQAVIDFPALRVENDGEFGGLMERA
jgi:hypothetical protein